MTYQAFKASDPVQTPLVTAINGIPDAAAAAETVLQALFTQTFINNLGTPGYTFSDTGTFTVTGADGKTYTTTGSGGTTIQSALDAANNLYAIYIIVPAMQAELSGMDFTKYFPADQATLFAYLGDATDYYQMGPGALEDGNATYAMAQYLLTDFFKEVNAVAAGNLTNAAKLRFAHAETIEPFTSILGLKNVFVQIPKAQTYTYATNSLWNASLRMPTASPWRDEIIAPMAANVQWDVFSDGNGSLLVKMMLNEQEVDFQDRLRQRSLRAGEPVLQLRWLEGLLQPALRPTDASSERHPSPTRPTHRHGWGLRRRRSKPQSRVRGGAEREPEVRSPSPMAPRLPRLPGRREPNLSAWLAPSRDASVSQGSLGGRHACGNTAAVGGEDRQEQLAVVDEPVLGLPARKPSASVEDDGHPLPALVHDPGPRPGNLVQLDIRGHGTAGEKAGDHLVSQGLPKRETLGCHGVGEAPRRVELQAILEEPQADLASSHRIVAVGDRIGHRFEHGEEVELGEVLPAAGRELSGGDLHVAAHELAGLEDLLVEGAHEVLRVELVHPLGGGRDVGSRIRDRLDESPR